MAYIEAMFDTYPDVILGTFYSLKDRQASSQICRDGTRKRASGAMSMQAGKVFTLENMHAVIGYQDIISIGFPMSPFDKDRFSPKR